MREVTLEGICTINPRKPPELDPEGECSFVPMGHVDDQFGIISEMSVRRVADVEKGYTSFQEGDVLFAKITPCMENGKCAVARNLVNGIGFGSTEFHVLRAEESVIPEWVYYYLRQKTTRKRAERSMTGSAGQRRVPASFLKEALIPLPPLPEQQRIAALLAKADRLRHLRRTARELSDTYLQSVFLEMFGDTIDGSTDTPLVPLGEICTKITDGTHKTPRYLDTGVPFLSVKNITQTPGQLDFSDVKYISREEHEQISARCNVGRDDILYTKVGTYGVPQVVNTDLEFSIFVSVALLKPNKSVVMPKYLEAALRTDFVKAQADRLVSGIGVPDLHLREIKTMLIPLPSFSQQREFVDIVHKFERLRTQQREAERQAEHLFQALLERAFRGEV